MPKREKQVWFCARESGLSYYPATWQGYVVLTVYILLLAASSLTIQRSWKVFFGLVAGLSVVLFIVVGLTSADSEF